MPRSFRAHSAPSGPRPSARATSAATWTTTARSVPASGRTCSTVPSRPGTLRWTNQAPPPGSSRWWRLRTEPSTRACTASGRCPASARRTRRAGRSASRTAGGPWPSVPSPAGISTASTASTTASAPLRHTARLTRCQPTRRGPSAGSDPAGGSHSPHDVTTRWAPSVVRATASTRSSGSSRPANPSGTTSPWSRRRSAARRVTGPPARSQVRSRLLAQRLRVLLQRHEVAEQLEVGVGVLDRVRALQPRLDLRDLLVDQRQPQPGDDAGDVAHLVGVLLRQLQRLDGELGDQPACVLAAALR